MVGAAVGRTEGRAVGTREGRRVLLGAKEQDGAGTGVGSVGTEVGSELDGLDVG